MKHTQESLASLKRNALIQLAIQTKAATPSAAYSSKSVKLIEAILGQQTPESVEAVAPTAAPAAEAPAIEVETKSVAVAEPEDGPVIEEPFTGAVINGADNVVPFDPEPPVQTEIPSAPAPTDSHGLFKIGRAVFQRQLAIAGRVAKGGNMPVLGCVLLSFGDGRMTVEGTNLDVYVSSEAPAETKGGFRLAVPAAVLSKFVARCSSEHLMAEVRGSSLHISDLENRTNIMGISVEEWPPAPTGDKATDFMEITGKQLNRVLTETLKSASTDETRYILCSVGIDTKKGVVVATDGRRLTRAVLGADKVTPHDSTTILPSFAAEVIRQSIPLDARVKVSATDRRLVFAATAPGFDVSIYTRTIDGNYPNYAQVIPAPGYGIPFVADRKEMLSALGRMVVLMSKEGQAVRLEFADNELSFSLASAGVGAGKEEIAIKGELARDKETGKPVPMALAVNPAFLQEILGSWSDERVTLAVKDSVSALLLTGDAKTAVVMPVRLS
jgi:DNA polymerase III beta subunit